MGRAFGEQIAVLDGLDEGSSSIDYDYDASADMDGRIGQQRADAGYDARVVARGPAGIIATRRRMVIDASEGANYSGGSSYAPRLPLLPSTVGLAAIPSMLPPRRNVLDYSDGGNYSGGASWTGGLPLLPSNAGLAAALIAGGYGRDGLGRSLISGGYGRDGLGRGDEGYGRAGLGAPMPGADSDLAGAFAAMEQKALDPSDGRLGQQRPGTAWGRNVRQIAPNTLVKNNVIDPSGGANYSGGSSWAPGIPLISSNSGLAGLDAMGDKVLKTAIAKLRRSGVNIDKDATTRAVGKSALDRIKGSAARIQRLWATLNPAQKSQAMESLRALGMIRMARANILRASAQA